MGDFYARGLAQLQALEETIVLGEDDQPETVYEENMHWIPDDTKRWLGKYGVSDAPYIVRVTVRAKNPSNPDADPVFEAYCSINKAFMFITYMNRGAWSTDNIYAANHPLKRRAYMSEWIYRTWREAANKAKHTGEALPTLFQVAIANINNVAVSGAIESLKLASLNSQGEGSNQGELFQGNDDRQFVTFFGMPLVRAIPRALWSMSRSFRQHFPTRIAWRSGGSPYLGEGHTGQEIELDDRFLIISLASLRLSSAARLEVMRRMQEAVAAEAAEEKRKQQEAEK
ncbi:hypothetical protein PspLS_10176 [Pyricularia sp. CBS 133598]|nr:hypothetical protein PspLS_10176 [Pyricularia sp. CBS 133598]